MERLADRSLYPGERLIAPGVLPAERRWEDAGKGWMDDIAKESFAGSHLVFDVPPGGETYSLTFLAADDESMSVRGIRNFSH